MKTSWRSRLFYTALAVAAVGASYYLGGWQTWSLDEAETRAAQAEKNFAMAQKSENPTAQIKGPPLSLEEIQKKLDDICTQKKNKIQWLDVEACEALLKDLDPTEALKLAEAMPPGEIRDGVRWSVMSDYADKNPQGAMDFLGTLPHGEAVSMFAAVTDSKNMETVKIFAQNLDKIMDKDDKFERDEAIHALSLPLIEDNPTQGLNWLKQVTIGDEFTSDLADVFDALSSTEGGSNALYFQGGSRQNLSLAMTLLSEVTDPGQRAAAIGAMAGGWGKADPQAAMTWAAGLPDTDSAARTDALNSIVGSWAKLDPAAALAFVQSNGNAAQFYPSAPAIAASLAQGDAPAALAFAQSLPEGATRDRAMNNVLTTLAATDFPSAWNDAQSLPEGASRDSAMVTLLGQQAKANPAQALDLLSQFSAGAALDSATHALASEWVDLDPQSAATWINTLPTGSQRDGAVAAMVWSATGTPLEGLQWANSIDSPTKRADVIQELITQWANDDPAAATSAVQSANLTEEQRAALVQTIQQARAKGR